MAKKRPSMGMHTADEQEYALRLAREQVESAKKSMDGDSDWMSVQWVLGYLNAMLDLAEREGASMFSAEIKSLISELVRYS